MKHHRLEQDQQEGVVFRFWMLKVGGQVAAGLDPENLGGLDESVCNRNSWEKSCKGHTEPSPEDLESH